MRLKVGDTVKIKESASIMLGNKIGVIVEINPLASFPLAIKFNDRSVPYFFSCEEVILLDNLDSSEENN